MMTKTAIDQTLEELLELCESLTLPEEQKEVVRQLAHRVVDLTRCVLELDTMVKEISELLPRCSLCGDGGMRNVGAAGWVRCECRKAPHNGIKSPRNGGGKSCAALASVP